MSALGQKQTYSEVRAMSVLLPTTDIRQRIEHVGFVPYADINPIAADRIEEPLEIAVRHEPR